jgi:hypothetical protein
MLQVQEMGNERDQTRPDVGETQEYLFYSYFTEKSLTTNTGKEKKQNGEAEEIAKKKRRKTAMTLECGPIQDVPLRCRVWTWQEWQSGNDLPIYSAGSGPLAYLQLSFGAW